MPTEMDFNELFNDSLEAVQHSDEFYELFYEKFINSSILIKKAFENTDMTVQKTKLKESLAYLVNFSVTKRANEHLMEMAQGHVDLNISVEMYDLFINTLLSTLNECDPKFSNECGIAWRIILSPGIEFMKYYGDIASK